MWYICYIYSVYTIYIYICNKYIYIFFTYVCIIIPALGWLISGILPEPGGAALFSRLIVQCRFPTERESGSRPQRSQVPGFADQSVIGVFFQVPGEAVLWCLTGMYPQLFVDHPLPSGSRWLPLSANAGAAHFQRLLTSLQVEYSYLKGRKGFVKICIEEGNTSRKNAQRGGRVTP